MQTEVDSVSWSPHFWDPGDHNGQEETTLRAGFRQRMIELVLPARTPEELAREFGPSAQAIRNWVAQADQLGQSTFECELLTGT